MSNSKVSALTSATTPLAGTEVLPIVQGSTTVKVSVANLTAGRPVAMAGGSFTDNITQSTAAKGINFTANTPAAGMTSQLLNAYEEGTWTPNQGAGLTVVGAFSSSGTYTRIGRQVTVTASLTGSTSIAAGAQVIIVTNLPFTCVEVGTGVAINSTVNATGTVLTSAANIYSATGISATGTIYFSVTYPV
jgi:hypothetical protein